MNSKYSYIIVQSVRCNNGVQHGDIHVCPIPGQYPFTPDMFVECPKSMKTDYPVGTKFRIKAKITDKEGGELFIKLYQRTKKEKQLYIYQKKNNHNTQ